MLDLVKWLYKLYVINYLEFVYCPIDTFEGVRVGLTGSLAIQAKNGSWWSLEVIQYYLGSLPILCTPEFLS